jgi:hypothetical protein
MMLRDELVAQGVKELKHLEVAGFAFDNVSRSLLYTKKIWPWKDMCLMPPYPMFWAETYQPVAGPRPDTRMGALIRADDHGVGPQDARWTLYGRTYLDNFSTVFDWIVDVDKTGRPLWQSPTTYTGRNAAMAVEVNALTPFKVALGLVLIVDDLSEIALPKGSTVSASIPGVCDWTVTVGLDLIPF